jgi:5-methylcytosine-specific restriction endonuclease McrA
MRLLLPPTGAPSPTPLHRSPTVDYRMIVGSVLRGIWMAATSSPWIAVGLSCFVVMTGVQTIQSIRYPSGVRDPVRRFSRVDKAVILARAGQRCEHHGWIFGRCKATAGLEADHVHPHSRGGWTNVANGQALCHTHNRAKRANIPYNWQLRNLQRRRAGYFPVDVPVAVIRRASSAHARRRPARIRAARSPSRG